MSSAAPGRPDPQAVCGLCARLGYEFRDPALLQRALWHASFTREGELDPALSNERLEFLGDAVVQLAVSAHLYDLLGDHDEGQLTTLRSFVVRGRTLARAAEPLGLGAALVMGQAAEQSGSRQRRSVLACGLEAVFGAVFLDGGWEAAQACVLAVLSEHIAEAIAERHRNYKGELQERAQEGGRQTPDYRLAEVNGPPHDRRFVVQVALGARVLASGAGASKKEAEQAAAAAALVLLDGESATSG
jgi:ribonuclease-3